MCPSPRRNLLSPSATGSVGLLIGAFLFAVSNTLALTNQQAQNSVVCDLDLSGLDDVLTVLSGRTATNAIMHALMQDHPAPKDWLPRLFQKRKDLR